MVQTEHLPQDMITWTNFTCRTQEITSHQFRTN